MTPFEIFLLCAFIVGAVAIPLARGWDEPKPSPMLRAGRMLTSEIQMLEGPMKGLGLAGADAGERLRAFIIRSWRVQRMIDDFDPRDFDDWP